MIKTKVLIGQEAKDNMLEGVKILADAVTTTLGPRGQNVAIGKADPSGRVYERIVLHDGVSVARSIDIEDEFVNMGAQLLKQAAQKQVQEVGDGTTVVVCLARAIIEEANKMIVAGVNPMELRKGIEAAVDKLTKEIEKLAIPITTLDQKKYIATVSAEDNDLGSLVAKTIDDMGVEGLVAVEESKDAITTVEKQVGMQLENGYVHQLFVTNPERLEAVVENPRILITDKVINSLEPFAALLNHIHAKGDSIVMICPSFGQEALAALIDNKLKGVLPSIAINAPSFGVNQKNILQDIALFTGAKYITADAGHNFEEVTIDDLGTCEHISSTKSASIIVGGGGDKKIIEKRVAEIKLAIANETEDFDREKLKERLAKLTTGVSIIKVGGATEVEMRERLERVKDAVEATKAAITSGIVPGGETVYLYAREKLDKKSPVYNLMYGALYQPFKKLLNNAGMNDGEHYEKLKNQETKFGMGIDVTTGEIVDMVKRGIIDPAMVSIQALTNASSVAIQILSTGAVVIPYDTMSKLQNK